MNLSDIPPMAAALDALAAQVRAVAEASGRRADADAAYEIAEAAVHLREADRRLAPIRADEAARDERQKQRNLYRALLPIGVTP